MTTLAEIVAQGEFEHYGIRVHRAVPVVGKTLGKSKVWINGECTEEELDGISTIKINSSDNIADVVEFVRKLYDWDNSPIVLVGGFSGQWGEDDGEYIIRDNVCLAVI